MAGEALAGVERPDACSLLLSLLPLAPQVPLPSSPFPPPFASMPMSAPLLLVPSASPPYPLTPIFAHHSCHLLLPTVPAPLLPVPHHSLLSPLPASTQPLAPICLLPSVGALRQSEAAAPVLVHPGQAKSVAAALGLQNVSGWESGGRLQCFSHTPPKLHITQSPVHSPPPCDLPPVPLTPKTWSSLCSAHCKPPSSPYEPPQPRAGSSSVPVLVLGPELKSALSHHLSYAGPQI